MSSKARRGKKYKLEKYKEELGDNQKWVRLTKIIVPTEYDKQQLLEAFRYIHDRDIDTELMAVNTIAHLYLHPDMIEVQEHPIAYAHYNGTGKDPHFVYSALEDEVKDKKELRCIPLYK